MQDEKAWGLSKALLGAFALALSLGGTGCVFPAGLGESNHDDDPPDFAVQNGCTGTVSGAVSGTIEHCTQTVVTETPSGKVTHGLVGLVGEQQVTIVFEFESEPPAPGRYDSTNLPDYQATLGLLGWGASWDAHFDDVPEGDFTLQLSGGAGGRLAGSIDATCIPILADDAGGNVTMKVTFPP